MACDVAGTPRRADLRLAALSQAKVVFVWSHDSGGVGEDGPTGVLLPACERSRGR